MHHHSQEAGCGEVEDEYLGVSTGDGGADDDDHDYDEDEGQCWYLGVTTGERGRMLKKITAVHLSLKARSNYVDQNL